jgi:glycosyltransferase involved in cell wall biosynthesis
MKICFTVEFFDEARGGGAGMVIRELASRLAKAGHEMTVATSNSPALSSMDGKNGITLAGFDVRGKEISGITGESKEFTNFLCDGDFDVIMNYAAQSWHTDLTMQAIESGELKTPAVLAPCGYSALGESLWRDYFQRMPNRLARYKACIYHSAHYQDFHFAETAGLSNSVVIHNGASEKEFGKLPAPGTFRKEFNLGGGPLLLCVANHFTSKGHHFVIDAFAKSNRQDALLVLIGGPPGTDFIGRHSGCTVACKIKQLTNRRRIFNYPNLGRHQIIAAYADADLFLFGSNVECSPLAIIEAMAAGTPYLSRPVGNIAEWGGCGRIIHTPSEMALNINRLLNDRKTLAALGENGRSYWKSKLTWESIGKKYEETLSRAAKGDATPGKTKAPPKVSVILPVYNAEKYLEQSLGSILEGDFDDLEVIAVNDGSTDKSADILHGVKDPRLKVIVQDNLGVSHALNTALKSARGRYIARMDADDIATPDRFSKQSAYLDQNPEIDIIGSAFEKIDPGGNSIGQTRMMNHPLVIKRYMMETNCVVHPSVMVRSWVYRRFGGYKAKAAYVEDYDLWARAWPWLKIAALPEPLLKYRIHESQVTKKYASLQTENANCVRDMIWEQAQTTLENPARCLLKGKGACSELKAMVSPEQQNEVLQRHIAALGLVTFRALAKVKPRTLFQVFAELIGFLAGAPTQGLRLAGTFLKLLATEMSLGKAAEKFRQVL